MTDATEQRKDVNTRKVIEVLSAKFDEKLASAIKSVVTWEKLIVFGLAIVGGAWGVTTATISRAEARSEKAEAAVSTLRQDSGDAIQLVREELKDTRTDIRALSREIRTGKAQPRLSAPVPELPPNPIAAPKE